MDDSLLENFQCPVCFEYMDSKIYICTNGHSLCVHCLMKLKKCPICNIKLDIARRNINMEKAAKTMREWLASNRNNTGFLLPPVVLAAKKRVRLSLGSPLRREPSDEFLLRPSLQCPLSSCCFFTKHLLQLKIHLHNWHFKELQPIKQMYEGQPHANIRVRIYWDLGSAYTMFILSSTDAFFLIYIVRTPNSIQKASHYLNVLTISDQTSMYKFSCGDISKFSMYYQSRHQAQEGIEIDESCVEVLVKEAAACYFAKLNISKVASLSGD